VGKFQLKDAVGSELLSSAKLLSSIDNFEEGKEFQEIVPEKIQVGLQDFTPELARICGFEPVLLEISQVSSFNNGQKISPSWFSSFNSDSLKNNSAGLAVYFMEGNEQIFAGIVHPRQDLWQNGFEYGFVIGRAE
jgi:hypothetical protein